MRPLIAIAVAVSLQLAAAASAQEEAPPAGTQMLAEPNEDLTGWYEVTMKVPPTQCRLKPEAGGEWRAVVEATHGRRGGILLHLEQLKSVFTQPLRLFVGPDGSFGFSGSVPLDFGLVVPANVTLGGGVMPDRQSFDARFTAKHTFCSVEGTLSGKRTTAPPPPPPPVEQPPVGALLNSDGYVAAPASEPEPPAQPRPLPPSPLINGRYMTTLTVSESRCFGQDRRGRWSGMLELKPQPGILIPLQDYGPVFAEPIILMVEGLALKQSTKIRLKAGMIDAPVPATFTGNFTADGARFNVRFDAGTNFCRIGGTIEGVKA